MIDYREIIYWVKLQGHFSFTDQCYFLLYYYKYEHRSSQMILVSVFKSPIHPNPQKRFLLLPMFFFGLGCEKILFFGHSSNAQKTRDNDFLCPSFSNAGEKKRKKKVLSSSWKEATRSSGSYKNAI